MAKKKKQQQQPKAQPSNMITNLPMKGMVKDVDSSYVDKQNWSHARNAINNSIDGDTGVIGNEPANILCAEIPYTVIGGIHLYGDKWIIFSTDNDTEYNDKSSEIGEFDDSTCTYTTLVNDSCLNFHKDNLVIGVAKENFDCGWQIYWDDGRNPSRTLPISEIPWKQYQTSPVGVDCVTYENITPLQLDCEKIRLAPLLDTPTLKLSKAAEGGQLPNGMYQVFVAYSHNDQIIGDYIGVSNPQPLWSYENNAGSLDLRISNLDKEFEWMQVVVRTRVHNGYSSYILGYYSTETTQLNIDYLDPDLEKVKSSRLLLRNPAYEKSEGMFEVNDYLIRTQPTEQFDFNYQPLANNIVTEWTSTAYPANYYKNGGNKPTFLRDEIYTFFIRFIYNTGEKSKSYHIPGREPEVNAALAASEDGLDITINNFNNAEPVFKVHNTASYSGALTGTTEDGGTHVGYGKMGFWEAKTERYPATDPTRWGDLCGKLIRHHKMPDENTHTSTRLSDGAFEPYGGNPAHNIYVLGAQFSNIAAPIDNQGNIIQNITGYEILVGNRDGNKSIIAKGIIRNMMSYERSEHSRTTDPSYGNHVFPNGANAGGHLTNAIGPIAARSWSLTQASPNPIGQSDINFGLMPNYPYNDTQTDPFLNHRGAGDVDPNSFPWFQGLLGGDPVENNWITGQGSLLSNNVQNASIHYSAEMSNNSGLSRGLNEFTRNFHTFHSPDLNFTHMYLAPSELVVYKTLTGLQTGQFLKSEKHPGAKLLKNRAVLVAAIIGVGYALNKMRGKRNVKINTAKSQSTGETMAVGSGMTPMPGTGTAAAAVNVLLSIPGTVIGAASEIAFNTVVDVASIFGAGKLARQIGAPVYQMIEAGTTGLMAGHIGPNKTIEYQGSDFTSVPTLFSMVTGLLSFLNYVAIGGDKIIDLILTLVDYQDYAYKYNSHGFYSTYNPFLGGNVNDLGTTSNDGLTTVGGVPSNQFRHQVERARYIKPGINYFDGDIPVNNLHRPSTVVVKTMTDVDSPSNHSYIDNSKFTIGGGKCAGVFDYDTGFGVVEGSKSISWWTPTGTATTSIAAQYVGLKVDNDNQYGQLDSILFTPISQPFRFIDPANTQIQQQSDIDINTRFSTGPLFGGDTYISRYTEKVIMPFWFDFMKDGPDGLPFDYRFYSNIPFPRYWMNTEKYRMDEFVRPIKNLSFKFDEAYPTDMYHLDSPTFVDCTAINSEYNTANSGNSTSNYNEEYNFHLQVVQVQSSPNIMATLDNRSKSPTWEIAGVAKSQFITHPAEDASWYANIPGAVIPVDQNNNPVFEPEREREVAAGIQGRHVSHNHSTPLIDWSGGSCISSGKDDWYDFCNPGDDVSPPRKTDIDGYARPWKALYNWNSGQFVCPVLWATPNGVIGAPNYAGGTNNSRSCNHQGRCWIGGVIDSEAKTLKACIQANGNSSAWTAGVNYWEDSCIPEDNPRDFRYYSSKQKKKEKGWFSGTIVLDQGSFNVGGSNNTLSLNHGAVNYASVNIGGDNDCDGVGTYFCRPGSPDRDGFVIADWNQPTTGGLNPEGCYNQTLHTLIAKGGAPPKAGDIGAEGDSYDGDKYDANGTSAADNDKPKKSGLFVETLGYMYTHISGVNDFYVESDMNLAFRDWEDVPRKRHYDNEEFTDINTLFHVDHIQSDNYYKYDQSLGIRRLWTASFGQIQPRWYDPIISETCFINYPKRLLYSLPSVGVHTKELQQFKRDEVADHWRTFLPENFRDFKSKVNTVAPVDKTGALILFPTLSPQLFQGVDSLQLAKSGNKLVIGDGGLFSQPFQNVVNSNVSHEYGSCESSRSVVNTPSGLYFVSQAQGRIFQYTGKGLKSISDSGMKWWFNKYLPSQLLKDFPEIENSTEIIDNPVVSAGVLSIYDPNNDLVYFCKRDYKAHADKIDDISIVPETDGRLRFMYSDAVLQQSVEIDVTDEDYFEDISWTVSYDPKAGAWISFHDWHPELAFNSINHFLTTKKGITGTPVCPPGYTYNGSTQQCEMNAQGSEPAQLINDVILATNNSINLSQPATNVSSGGACKLDIVIACDISGSNTPNTCAGQNAFVANFLDAIDLKMDGSISGGIGTNDIQVGLLTWSTVDLANCANMTQGLNVQVSKMSTSSSTLKAFATNSTASQILGVQEGGSDFYEAAIQLGLANLNDYGSSSLGNRSSDPNYRRVLIVVTDATTGAACTNSLPPNQPCGIDMPNDVWNVGTNAGNPNMDIETYAIVVADGNTVPGNWEQATDCLVQIPSDASGPGPNQYAGTIATLANVGTTIGGEVCNYNTCECPDATWTMTGNCSDTETPTCTKVSNDCECPTATPPYTLVGTCDASSTPTCERQTCSCASTPGYGTAANWETGTCGDAADPLMCNYDFSDTVSPNYDIVGIWRHNARTDKFANFYGIDYPWEVDLLQTSGQQVTTLRNVEYMLESYVYKNDGRDRFHVLDFNFDEAEIYNTEQTSGLLKLNITPKNNVPLMTTYPIINANDIDILYSKEEQKYRFNQFWDVTLDRGEFTGVENTIYITKLNGYIRDLNNANIDLLKSSFERKRFRHYYNHIILRRSVSDDKKMLLRLNNAKLNMSSR